MPLKLVPPREGKSPNYTIRGTYQRVYVNRTAGTPEKRAAQKVLDGVKKQIERGEYRQPDPEPIEEKRPPTFADAALAYLKGSGDPKYVSRIIEDTSEHALAKMPLALLYVPDTKNGEPRPVYLPVVLVKAFRDQPARAERPRKAAGGKLARGEAGRSQRDAGVPFLARAPSEKLFRFHVGGHLRDMLALAIEPRRPFIPAPAGRLPFVLPHIRNMDDELWRPRHVRPCPHQTMEKSRIG
jgi:hypothetical protein